MDLVEEERRLGNWPRRLLYVPTMTSYPWQEGDVYSGVVRPPYNAISYTWGRWRLKKDDPVLDHVEAIDIKGTDWHIPRIHPTHFTPAQFHRAIKAATCSPFRFQDLPSEMLASVEFLWLDVACIDQREAEPRSAAEVGRQAVIFDGARHVFIWSSSRSTENFESLIASTAAFGQLAQDSDEPQWDAVLDDDRGSRGPVEVPASAPVWTLFLDILEDPWWSSLWTLQEAYMRPDACLLSSDGLLVTFPRSMQPYHPWRLSDLLITYDRLSSVCEQAVHHNADPWYVHMRDLHTQKGLRALATRNPIATYEAANNRQTSHQADRVYGIQQIFNLRIGNTAAQVASTPRKFSLDDLEEQLGLELLSHLPVSSQFHVFTEPTKLASQWRLQRYSVVPKESATYTCYMDEVSPNMEGKCSFTVAVGTARGESTIEINGLMMPLERLLLATKRIRIEEHSDATVNLLKLYLDASPKNASTLTAHYTGKTDDRVIHWLLASYAGHEIRIICLGVAFGLYSCRIYGVVVVAQQLAWKRLGLCFWETFIDQSHSTISSMPELNALFLQSVECRWQPFCGLYGTASGVEK